MKKKIIGYFVFVAASLFLTSTQIIAEEFDFLGRYYGGRMGINNSKATGAIFAPGESTVAYVMQGGYIQGGVNEQFGKSIVGVGGYVDWHGYEKHSNGVAYGGHAYGLDAKLAIPVEDWLPYVKIGYGYSTGTGDLSTVSQYGFNKALGGEYKLDSKWTVMIEYKVNVFQGNSTHIENRTTMIGFNYYFRKPVKSAAPVEDLTLEPAPEKGPDIPPDFAPPP